jgi:hypothetical protein
VPSARENHSTGITRWASFRASTAAGRLDGGDVDLFHPHHRLERALGDRGIGIGDRCLWSLQGKCGKALLGEPAVAPGGLRMLEAQLNVSR